MTPVIHARGFSFKGICAYLMHDVKAASRERVEWTETNNLHTQNITTAAKVMAWTDINAQSLKRASGVSTAGAWPSAGGVYHMSISWEPSETPEPEHMGAMAKDVIERLGLAEYQYFMVAHKDTTHKHIHIVCNLTHPVTGKRKELSYDKKTVQKFALEYEREHGIFCHVREENAAKRAQGIPTKHRVQKQDYSESVTRAYQAADNGKAFVHALAAEGLHLAAARRGAGFLVIDNKGNVQKLARQLTLYDGQNEQGEQVKLTGRAKTDQINQKLADLDRALLPDGDILSKQIKTELHHQKLPPEKQSYSREAEEVKQQIALEKAAFQHGKKATPEQRKKPDQKTDASPAPEHKKTAQNPPIRGFNVASGATQQKKEVQAAQQHKEQLQKLQQWASHQRTNLQSRHFRDLNEREQGLSVRGAREKGVIEAYYQPHILEYEVRLKALEQTSTLQRFFKGRTIDAEREDLQKSLADGCEKRDDAKQRIDRQLAQDKAAFQAQQAQEKSDLAKSIDNAYKNNAIPNIEHYQAWKKAHHLSETSREFNAQAPSITPPGQTQEKTRHGRDKKLERFNALQATQEQSHNHKSQTQEITPRANDNDKKLERFNELQQRGVTSPEPRQEKTRNDDKLKRFDEMQAAKNQDNTVNDNDKKLERFQTLQQAQEQSNNSREPQAQEPTPVPQQDKGHSR